MAPDILHALADPSWHKNLKYNQKADIYSIGVIMFILLIGKPPFNAGDYKELFSKVNYGIYSIPKDLKLSKQCITLMNGMLMQESEKRFSILEVLRSDFLMKPYEKFEMIDFSEFENSNKNNNFNIEQNEKNIFLDIKQMISFENKKQPQQQNEKISSNNKENMNVILNDMNNKDEELEMLLEQLKNNKIESTNLNINDFYSSNSNNNNNNKNNNINNNEKNFLAPPLQEETGSSSFLKKTGSNNIPDAKSNINAINAFGDNNNNNYKNNKANEANNYAKNDDMTKQIRDKEVKEQEKEKNPYLNLNNPNNNANKNLINLDNYDNIKEYNNKESGRESNRKNTDQKLAKNGIKDDVMLHKDIFDIPMQKLDNIFDMINKKFEMFEMEAIPIYLENPKLYENFIL